MTRDEFDTILRTNLRREPFVPFQVGLKAGKRIEIDDPNGLAFNCGGAAFIDAGGGLIFFNFEAVNEIVA
jgi:hypothetical protein